MLPRAPKFSFFPLRLCCETCGIKLYSFICWWYVYIFIFFLSQFLFFSLVFGGWKFSGSSFTIPALPKVPIMAFCGFHISLWHLTLLITSFLSLHLQLGSNLFYSFAYLISTLCLAFPPLVPPLTVLMGFVLNFAFLSTFSLLVSSALSSWLSNLDL